ncbi:hypothetical protein [Azohydromonas sediminis]|uniref:hypothetical protein n=1 Tax=Azohydromonas sediminis TaxID=2259674 RepID=UPI000E651EC3|nr:hypothetical protein [Azohydromonas sediminis]
MKHLSVPGLVVLVLCTSLLTGCGGDDHVTAPALPSDSVPEAVASSVDALIAFAKGLASDDSAEPLSLGTVVPAVDDTIEPASL